MMRDYRNYRSADTGEQIDEKMFRIIASEEGNTEFFNIKSIRLHKKRFKAYLTKLYNTRFAEKIVNLFEFVNPLDLTGFCK